MTVLNVIEGFVEEYLPMLSRSNETIKGYKNDLFMFNDWMVDTLGNAPTLEQIERKMIEKYLFYLKMERNYADNSRKRQLHSISSFLNYAIREGRLIINPCSQIAKFSVSKKERQALSDKEVHEMIDCAGDNTLTGVLISTLYFTGMRVSELCNLNFSDVDFESNNIKVREGKGKKDRTIPINSKLKSLLLNYKDSRNIQSQKFFQTKKTGMITQGYIRVLIKNVEKQLGWKKNISCHVLRHSFATSLLRKGVNLLQIQRLLGHSSLRTTEIYLHSLDEELQAAVNKL